MHMCIVTPKKIDNHWSLITTLVGFCCSIIFWVPIWIVVHIFEDKSQGVHVEFDVPVDELQWLSVKGQQSNDLFLQWSFFRFFLDGSGRRCRSVTSRLNWINFRVQFVPNPCIYIHILYYLIIIYIIFKHLKSLGAPGPCISGWLMLWSISSGPVVQARRCTSPVTRTRAPS